MTPALISQILAAVIGAAGMLTAGALTRAYESARRSNTEKVAQQKEIADTASGLKAVVEKLDEIKKEWRVDRRAFQSWQLRVEQRLARVEGHTGVAHQVPDAAPIWGDDMIG